MILEKINNKTLEDVKKREEKISLDELENIIADGNFPTKDVKKFLKSSIDEPIRIIAEVKKASPSKGVIKEDFDHLQIAKEYNDFGANAISILTEPHFFLGNLDYLKRQALHCVELGFYTPRGKEKVIVRTKPHDDIVELISKLGLN